MTPLAWYCLACAALLVDAGLHRRDYPPVPNVPVTDNVGDPLLLTPYIERGDIQEGQKLARVTGLPTDIESYSGYFTVNQEYNSNLYFWFFPALHNSESAPVVVWLQGGPGSSSIYALFVENGPFDVDESMNLVLRPTSWSNFSNLIYFDSPAGTGYSFLDDDRGYAQNEDDVARDLYTALTQFFLLFPQYQKNEFYITGESYAGKYVPAITYKIHKENPNASLIMNLKGMAIGNGLCDPVSMLDYATYLYNVGLLDDKEADIFRHKQSVVKDYIDKQEWIKGFHAWNDLLNNDLSTYPSLYTNFTGFDNYFSYLTTEDPTNADKYMTYVQLPEVRKALHVGNTSFLDGNPTVEIYLLKDMLQSVKPWVEEILNNEYRVLLYSGQVDVIVAHPLTQSFIRTLQWKGAEEYASSRKTIWRVGSDVAGYSKRAMNFSFIIVRNSGHMVPFDQPVWAYDLISRFVADDLP